MSRVPILVILGSTGTGKSRLSIELAQKYAGEVISADSMQVYKGLDIITAKVTKEERSLAPHHMLDVVDPLINFCVFDYRKKALPIINDLLTRRKMPIIVGGTNYYIESLLWQILVEDPKEAGNSMKRHDGMSFEDTKIIECENEAKTNITKDQHQQQSTLSSPSTTTTEVATSNHQFKDSISNNLTYDNYIESNESLHRRLAEIDPERAKRLHPNNRRKIIRSLEVYENHGTTHTEILTDQRTAGGSGLGGPLRFPNSLILWLRCDQEVLDKRLDQRVDSMLEAGLIKELLDFHERYNQEWIKINKSPDYTKGIFQSIGFKEFHNYLILSEDERNSEKGEQLFKQGIDDLKLATRRYARRQQKWVMNRFIRRVDRQVPRVFELDCTNVDEWNSKVYLKAIDIINADLKGEKPSEKAVNEHVQNAKHNDSSNEEAHWCDICEKVLIGELQWKAHMNGERHKRTFKKRKRFMEKLHEPKFAEQIAAKLNIDLKSIELAE